MDFSDSPEEGEFRSRLRAWVEDHNPGLPASSTSDDYWAGQAAWHRSLYDAGFFGLSWPEDVGGHASTVEDDLAELLGHAVDHPQRPLLDPRLVHRHREG